MSQEKNRNRAGESEEELPPIAKKIEDAVGETPKEAVSGDPNYAPDADYAAMKDDEVHKKGRQG